MHSENCIRSIFFDVNPDQAQAAIESLNEYDCETMAVTGDVTKKEDVENCVVHPRNSKLEILPKTLPENSYVSRIRSKFGTRNSLDST